jgi:hypothetical protein
MGQANGGLKMQLQKVLFENEMLRIASAMRSSNSAFSAKVPPTHESKTANYAKHCRQTFWSLQPTDLWRRAFEKLLPDFQSSDYFIQLWYEVYCSCVPVPSTDSDVAHRAATTLEESLSKAGYIYAVAPQHRYAAGLESSLNRLGRILNVVKGTLNFTTGGFIWTCICQITSVGSLRGCFVALNY